MARDYTNGLMMQLVMKVHMLILSIIIGCGMNSCSPDPGVDMSSFQIQEGFSLHLVAAEPHVMDPVAMEIDENGKIYVVEMPGYPLDVSGSGRVKILKDKDGDGVIDHSILFARDLILPTGIMRWKKGVIVTDAPDVIYLEDSDGDDIADKKEVILTGFSLSNPQHNMNTPKFGLDNWIYLGHEGAFITKAFVEEFGDAGSEIRFPGSSKSPSLPQNANDKSVRFQPDRGLLEMLSGKTQYGYTFDNWGHLFNSSNAMHLWHEVIAARYIQSENLPFTSAMNYIPSNGPGVEIYPTTTNPEHQLLTDIGVITSACGLTWYQGGSFPPQYDQVCFTAEPVHNLVYAEVVEPKGASFTSNRLFGKTEFLTSEDSWFRPVNFYIGPSGDLYVIDYYRQFIEHPEWMAEEVVESGALYNGQDKGRIYRVRWKATETQGQSIHRLEGTDLIPLLAHPNIWHRRNAQRLLMDQPFSQNMIDSMIAFALSTTSSLGLLHAMWTIEGMGYVDKEVIEKALTSPHAGVRENAIQIVELHWVEEKDLLPLLLDRQEDPDPRVRFQLLCTSASIEEDAAGEVFKKILLADIADEWIQRVALASTDQQTMELIQFVIESASQDQWLAAGDFVRKAAEMIGRKGEVNEVGTLISRVSRSRGQGKEWWRSSLLEGLAKGLKTGIGENAFQTQKQDLLDLFDQKTDPVLRRSALHLLSALGPAENLIPTATLDLALSAIQRSSVDPAWSVDAIRLLEMAGPSAYQRSLESLLNPTQPVEVQEAALGALHAMGTAWFSRFVFERWKSLTPSLHQKAMALLMADTEGMKGILTALEDQVIHRSNIPWKYTSRLMNNRNETIRQKARKLLAGDEMLEEELLEKYLPALEAVGNPAQGKAVYELVCSTCHQISGQNGVDFGPDLAPIRNRSKAAILNDLLFPNLAIADGYGSWEITLGSDREPVIGIISEELNENLVIRDATGKEVIVTRSDIVSLKPMTTSAMPAGLENQLTVDQMSDLIAYLKRPFL